MTSTQLADVWCGRAHLSFLPGLTALCWHMQAVTKAKLGYNPIIPMPPDEVLRKGSGTLCEMLLMVQAFKVRGPGPCIIRTLSASQLCKPPADKH